MSLDILQEPNLKYIRICEDCIRVKIERGDDTVIKSFRIRMFPSLEGALIEACRWRDEKHMELYGLPVTKKILHAAKRRNQKSYLDPKTGKQLPALPPGLSYGFHRSELLYVVVSIQANGRPKRIRIPIKEYGLEASISKAREIRLRAYLENSPGQ